MKTETSGHCSQCGAWSDNLDAGRCLECIFPIDEKLKCLECDGLIPENYDFIKLGCPHCKAPMIVECKALV